MGLSDPGAFRSYLTYNSFLLDVLVSMAILGGYATLIVLYKIKSALSGTPPEEEKSVSTVTVTGIPSIDSLDFEKFVETEAFEKLLEDEGQLLKLLESA